MLRIKNQNNCHPINRHAVKHSSMFVSNDSNSRCGHKSAHCEPVDFLFNSTRATQFLVPYKTKCGGNECRCAPTERARVVACPADLSSIFSLWTRLSSKVYSKFKDKNAVWHVGTARLAFDKRDRAKSRLKQSPLLLFGVVCTQEKAGAN